MAYHTLKCNPSGRRCLQILFFKHALAPGDFLSHPCTYFSYLSTSNCISTNTTPVCSCWLCPSVRPSLPNRASCWLPAARQWDLQQGFLEPATVAGLKNWHNYDCLFWPDRFTVILFLKVTFRRILVGCLCTCLELQLVQKHGVPKHGALGITSVGTVLGGIFSPFQHTVCYRTVLDPMGYSPASDGLNVNYLWVRKQDFDGGIIWMGLSNPALSCL